MRLNYKNSSMNLGGNTGKKNRPMQGMILLLFIKNVAAVIDRHKKDIKGDPSGKDIFIKFI